MSLLFHGSYTVVITPLVKAGRRNLDFGEGFYMTRLLSQAEKWAKTVASRNPNNKRGFVTEYEIDDEIFTEQDWTSCASNSLIIKSVLGIRT